MIAGFDNYFNRPPLAPAAENLEGKDAKARAEKEKAEKEKYPTAEAKKVLAETKIPTTRPEIVTMADYLKNEIEKIIDQQVEKMRVADKGAEKVYVVENCLKVVAELEHMKTQASKPPPADPPAVDVSRLHRPLGLE
jgi:hypothetical protein